MSPKSKHDFTEETGRQNILVLLRELSDTFHQDLAELSSGLKALQHAFNEQRQYNEADFEVLNLRFDRIEDRMDRLDSSPSYEH